MSTIERERSFLLVDLASTPTDNTVVNSYDGANITFFEGLPIRVDNVIPSVNDFVLLKDQTDATQNGIWEVVSVTGGGNTVTMSNRLKLTPNRKFFTLGGDTNAGKYYIVDNTGTITNGLTEVSISQYFPPNPIITPP